MDDLEGKSWDDDLGEYETRRWTIVDVVAEKIPTGQQETFRKMMMLGSDVTPPVSSSAGNRPEVANRRGADQSRHSRDRANGGTHFL